MQVPSILPNEQERLAALRHYEILDTLPEPEYNYFVQLASKICETPISLISLVDRDRQWFKAHIGLEYTETPRDVSFCGHVVASATALIVNDTLQDDRFADHPLVLGEPYIRFYASFPLITPDHYVLGTLCVIDHKPRHLAAEQLHQLELLSRLVMSQLELRRKAKAARAMADTSLQASRHRYATLAEIAPVGIFHTDAAGCCLYVNDRWCQLSGLTASQAMGKGWQAALHPDDRESVLADWDQFLREHQPFQREYRFQTSGGQVNWVYGRATTEYDLNGQILCHVGTVTDINALRQAELALAQSESQSQAVLVAIPDLMFRVGRDGVYRGYVTQRSNLDLVPDSINPTGRSLFEMLPAKLAEAHFCALQKALQTGEMQVYEHQVQVGDRLQYEEVRVVKSGADEVLFMIRDVSDLKQVERQLQELNQSLEAKVARRTKKLHEREQFLQTVLDTFPLAVFWKDREAVMLGCNQLFAQLHGFSSPQEVVGKSICDLGYPEADMQAYLATDREVIESGQAKLNLEETMHLPGREERWVETNKMPLRDLEGNIIGILGTFQDITDRKQAEAALQRTNEELARATRMKDEFLASMSHELRTPLNAILGMTEGLQEGVFGTVNPQQQKALETIDRSAAHLLELINDILDLAKVESGHIALDLAPTEILPLCTASLAFVKQQALKKQIQFKLQQPASGIPDLELDERRIRQVLINLLNNAVKFTPEKGEVTLAVSFQHGEPQPALPDSEAPDCIQRQSFLRISVIDTGIGIAPEHLDQLFQPFIQIDNALNRQHTGTGLGLALVKQIVELHGGQVSVTSQVGVGSCFTIELPCCQAAVASQIQTQTVHTHPLTSSICFSAAPLLLLADDNEANLKSASSYLRCRGYRIVVATDGQEAIELALAEKPELILMDIQMPRIDGLEAIRQIRKIPEFANTPILAATALAMAGDRDRCLAAGANDYIPKPFKLKHLASLIQQLLSPHQTLGSSN